MARNNALNFNLPSVDDLFSTEESRAEARLEKVVNLNPSEISDFPDHPFKVRMDAAMQEMAESVKQYGVLVPALVRPKQGGGYEMVAGHRRKMAAELAQLPEIPCIVRNLSDDEATIIMVDSNLQREQILPSEKGFAYRMKLDAMKRQGQRTDLTSATVLQKSTGKTSRQKIIHFDTLESFGEYEVIAAFKTVAYSQEGFKYYHFVRAESAEQFDEYIAECKKLALYDTGVTAEYGDKLITLSTCEYSRTNGRMVVVAKLLEE